ncbi:MAG: TlpA family protein disulfide reductase [Saprospiraceae bacterium]|nr:TlpA family protein disulfide reductase [Saprospiraceae bacterium]
MKKLLLPTAAILFIGYLVYYFFFNSMLVLGQMAPDFQATDLNNDSIKLEQFKGRYLLIEFWGSWCAPCRKENPILVMMYDKYRNIKFKTADGIDFLGVALEKNKEDAIKAIGNDGLNWPHHIIEENLMQSPIAQAYSVRSIPSKFLIGPDSRIILADPSIAELDAFLAYQTQKN